MKFEQAFYTSGINQLSKYKDGLGICAASNLEEGFLDRCLSLGSHFDPEHTLKTAEFTLYCEDFKAFVGVGISPGKDGGDGRTNMLCHLFIPVEREPGKEPEQYLLDFPFRRTVTDNEKIYQRDLKPDVYEYHDILEKYALHGIKLSILLRKVYLCAFDELQRLIFIVDRVKHKTEEYGRIAREITWLVSMLLPIPDEEPDLYRSKISYGVYTNENVKAVRFVFTDNEELGDDRFYLDLEPEQKEPIPQVYEAMAGWAEESPEYFREKINDMMQWKIQEKAGSSQLPLIYLRWKLEKKEGILSFSELEEEIEGLQVMTWESDWHKQFLVKYLKQEKQMDNEWLVSMWEHFICHEMKCYSDMCQEDKLEFGDAVTNVICMVYEQNQKNYNLFLNDLRGVPDLENKVLHNIYAQRGGSVYIPEEIKGCVTTESFCECVSRYSVLCDDAGLKEVFLKQAIRLYKPAGRKDRGSISSVMEEIDAGAWEKKIVEYVANGSLETESYMDFLESEMDRIEPDYVEMYYIRLWHWFEQNKAEWMKVKKAESELRKIGPVSDKYYKSIGDFIAICKKDEIEKNREIPKDDKELCSISNKENLEENYTRKEVENYTDRSGSETEEDELDKENKMILGVQLGEPERQLAEDAINTIINTQKDMSNQQMEILKEVSGPLSDLAREVSESNKQVIDLVKVLEYIREEQLELHCYRCREAEEKRRKTKKRIAASLGIAILLFAMCVIFMKITGERQNELQEQIQKQEKQIIELNNHNEELKSSNEALQEESDKLKEELGKKQQSEQN